VKKLKEPGLHADGGGLYLKVKTSGAKNWVFIWRQGTKRTEMGLGSFRVVDLAEARQKAELANRQISEGLNPLEERGRDQVEGPTFGEFALDHIAAKASQWKGPKQKIHWENSLQNHCRAIWNARIAQVGTEDVLNVLKPIWSEIPDMARRVRGRMEDILAAAKVLNHRRGDNPAQWKNHLEYLLPQQKRLTRGHMAAMPYNQLNVFIRDLRKIPAVSCRALEFLILTGARTIEIIGAKWNEVDRVNKIWTVPAERMKGLTTGNKPVPSPAAAHGPSARCASIHGIHGR
jgi:hypothetical protein